MKKKECKSIKKCNQELLQLSSQYWTNYKTSVSSTDVTVTGWEKGKPKLVKLKHVTQAGVQAAAGGSSPIQHHPFSMCTSPNTWLPSAFKLSPLAPNMRSRAPGTMEVSMP